MGWTFKLNNQSYTINGMPKLEWQRNSVKRLQLNACLYIKANWIAACAHKGDKNIRLGESPNHTDTHTGKSLSAHKAQVLRTHTHDSLITAYNCPSVQLTQRIACQLSKCLSACSEAKANKISATGKKRLIYTNMTNIPLKKPQINTGETWDRMFPPPYGYATLITNNCRHLK